VILFTCPYEVSLIVPLPPQGCVCILQTRPYFAIAFFPCLCFAFTITPLWVVFFHFSDFGRIQLFFLPFHIPYPASMSPVFYPLVC